LQVYAASKLALVYKIAYILPTDRAASAAAENPVTIHHLSRRMQNLHENLPGHRLLF
jgi:hypothetical protein